MHTFTIELINLFFFFFVKWIKILKFTRTPKDLKSIQYEAEKIICS